MTHRSTLSLKDAELLTSRIDEERAGANGSYFQTCLWGRSRAQRKIEVAMQNTVNEVEQGLLHDKMKFHEKYVDAQQRYGRQSNYTIELPKLGSNMKYSDSYIMKKKIEEGDLNAEKGQVTGHPRFNVPTLRQWFREIDADNSGEISVPELVNFLRSNKDLEQVMLLANHSTTTPMNRG